jgi:imidazole glycerol-phosphate synthase subunit HisF
MNTRIIPRLDVKGTNLIKGVHLEGLRVIGPVHEYAKKYYAQGADELLYLDIVASLFGRNSLVKIVEEATRDVFVPITVGGGVRSLNDVSELLSAGADKVAINTAAVRNPNLIKDISRKFGSQSIVSSIEAKHVSDGCWEVYTDSGRETTGLNALDWAMHMQDAGAGEVLLTSIDKEGTGDGFENELILQMSERLEIPLIVSGGYGCKPHLVDAVNNGASAIAIAGHLHYERCKVSDIRNDAKNLGIKVRDV